MLWIDHLLATQGGHANCIFPFQAETLNHHSTLGEFLDGDPYVIYSRFTHDVDCRTTIYQVVLDFLSPNIASDKQWSIVSLDPSNRSLSVNETIMLQVTQWVVSLTGSLMFFMLSRITLYGVG